MQKILQVLQGEAASPPPVWAMRQAGRCLASYRRLRKQVGSFRRMVETPEIAAEVTCLPVQELGVDAAIIFSDILVIPAAMGLAYRMEEGIGPVIEQPLTQAKDVQNLQLPPMEEALSYVMEALRLTRRQLPTQVPLIGFSGAPWTLLSYMVEGQGSKVFAQARRFAYAQPQVTQQALEKLSLGVIDYLQAQARAGAQVLQLFDPLAELLPPAFYEAIIFPHLKNICQALSSQPVPLLVFAKGTQGLLPLLSQLPCAGIGIDWCTPLAEAKRCLGKKVIQGNADPALLYAKDETIVAAAQRMVQEMDNHPYIANLGHGVYPDTAQDKVKLWVQTIQGK